MFRSGASRSQSLHVEAVLSHDAFDHDWEDRVRSIVAPTAKRWTSPASHGVGGIDVFVQSSPLSRGSPPSQTFPTDVHASSKDPTRTDAPPAWWHHHRHRQGVSCPSFHPLKRETPEVPSRVSPAKKTGGCPGRGTGVADWGDPGHSDVETHTKGETKHERGVGQTTCPVRHGPATTRSRQEPS